MFCPRCGTQNELKQGYCRQCGQALSSVRLAIEGNADQSLKKLKASQERINAGSAVLSVFTVIGLAIAALSFALHTPTLIGIALINLVLGLIIGLPLLYAGKFSLKRAVRLLSKSPNEKHQTVLDQAIETDKLLTNGLSADLPSLQVPGSVTEHTTLNLQESNRANRKTN
jgi:uncharacterized membrane protein YvbJ